MNNEHKAEQETVTEHKAHKNLWNEIFAGSKKARRVVTILIGVIAALLVFQGGVSVGYHKALFSYRGGERFINMMEGPEEAPIPMGFSAGHGAAGRIVSVSLPSFVVASPDNREETVILGDDTVIRQFRDTASSSAIRPEEFTVVLGEPDESGAIQARFVRIMPAPSTSAQGPSHTY